MVGLVGREARANVPRVAAEATPSPPGTRSSGPRSGPPRRGLWPGGMGATCAEGRDGARGTSSIMRSARCTGRDGAGEDEVDAAPAPRASTSPASSTWFRYAPVPGTSIVVMSDEDARSASSANPSSSTRSARGRSPPRRCRSRGVDKDQGDGEPAAFDAPPRVPRAEGVLVVEVADVAASWFPVRGRPAGRSAASSCFWASGYWSG